ncbi:MAG: hypothetical protein R3B06_27560 [Kofleriaceae bacterium]
MRSLAPLLVGVAALALGPGCADDGSGAVARGGWDRNTGNFNGNLGAFTTVSGLRGSPLWGATGPGTVTNASVFGLQYDPAVMPQCASATPGLTAVEFLSSSGSGAAAVGPDVQVTLGAGPPSRLAMGAEVVFGGHIVDGYQGQADAVFRIRRVDTLTFGEALWYQWPVFSLESCNNAGPIGAWTHLGFVSWAPMIELPELPGDTFRVRADAVQAITTPPRASYRDNPNVPASVAAQTGALWFKFAFYASLPIALHGEPALDLTTTHGAVVANAEFLWRGALALGNASWITLPPSVDAAQHRFPSFFTRDGTSISMFAVARGDGLAAGRITLPVSWGGDPVAPLELTDDERAQPTSLDSVHAMFGALAGADVTAAPFTHLGSGRSSYRAGLYAANSLNPRRLWNYGQWRSNRARMSVGGLGAGAIDGQAAVEQLVRPGAAPVVWAVGCESPVTGAMVPFEQPTNITPPPPDAPVNPPTADGGLDAGPDAGTDAPVGSDGGPPDAVIDDAAEAGMDAGVTDAPAGDAAEAGMDAGVTDAPADDAAEAGMDAGPAADASGVPDALTADA